LYLARRKASDRRVAGGAGNLHWASGGEIEIDIAWCSYIFEMASAFSNSEKF